VELPLVMASGKWRCAGCRQRGRAQAVRADPLLGAAAGGRRRAAFRLHLRVSRRRHAPLWALTRHQRSRMTFTDRRAPRIMASCAIRPAGDPELGVSPAI
jgi:hypothetical protein